MVFEKITLFEPHFDGANFDARVGTRNPADTDAAEGQDEHESDDSSRGVLVPLLVTLTVTVIAAVLVRRYLGDDAAEEAFDVDDSIEQSAD